jgi:hypothetical protein
MRMMPTGRTIAQQWTQAPDDAARREMLHGHDVRVVLHPRGAAQRVVNDPEAVRPRTAALSVTILPGNGRATVGGAESALKTILAPDVSQCR